MGDMVDAIAACSLQITELRELKRAVGTTLRLSSATLRIKQQLMRLRTLIAAKKGGGYAARSSRCSPASSSA